MRHPHKEETTLFEPKVLPDGRAMRLVAKEVSSRWSTSAITRFGKNRSPAQAASDARGDHQSAKKSDTPSQKYAIDAPFEL